MGNAVSVPDKPLHLDDLLSSNGGSKRSKEPLSGTASILHMWKFVLEDDDTVSSIPTDWSVQPKFQRHDCYIILHLMPNKLASLEPCRDSKDDVTSEDKLSLHDLLKSTKSLTPRGICNPFSFEAISAGDYGVNIYLMNGKRSDDAVQAYAVAKGVELKRKFHEMGVELLPICAVHTTSFHSIFVNDVKNTKEKRKTIHIYAELLEPRPVKESASKGKKSKRLRPTADALALPNLSLALENASHSSSASTPTSQEDGVPKRPGRVNLAPLTLPIIPRFVKDAPAKVVLSAGVERDKFASSEKAIKGNKLARFDVICSKITDQLYLGSDTVARDFDKLSENGITHILNCAGAVCDNYFPDKFTYKKLYLTDGVTEDISCLLFDIIEWMDDVLTSGGKVYVHCQQGVSRSSAMMIGYLMWKNDWPFEKTQKVVKDIRGVSSPNAGFIFHLLTLEKRLAKTSEDKSRLYEVVPQSKWDEEYLVGKEVSSADDRLFLKHGHNSCFILHTPECIYIWVGEDCPEETEIVGEATVRRIQRFEHATSSIEQVREKAEQDRTNFFKTITACLETHES